MITVTAPSLYEYYTAGGIHSGLSVTNPYFTLNEKNISIYSGAMHYFRIPKPYWKDRLRKMRAAGLNAVETYIPWNLHEAQIGQYDFGETTDFLDIRQFLKTAQEEDLLTIIRPGPYIGAEWEFGGLPSWLLRENEIKIRTSDAKFMKHVSRYFGILLQILSVFQFTLGGPIIGFQIENEYGSTEWKRGNESFRPDRSYLESLRQLFLDNGIRELLFTSDSPTEHGDSGTLPNIFQTANFARDPEKSFDKLKESQKNNPAMAMEFWTGWFDHWSEEHYLRNNSEFKNVLRRILEYPASLNMYMFHGGTSWGFLNGADIDSQTKEYQPDITSYDYDAPLSEAGDYTEKYFIVKNLLEKYNKIKTRLPELPLSQKKKDYGKIEIKYQLKFPETVKQLPHVIHSKNLMPMEYLQINNNSGQSYGYIIYRKHLNISENSTLKIKGHVHDMLIVLVNGKIINRPLNRKQDINDFGYWLLKDGYINLPQEINATLDLIVLNMGRNNFGKLEDFRQFKGLEGVTINEQNILDWIIMPLEFKSNWTKTIEGWQPFKNYEGMSMYKTHLVISDQPQDTFIDMSMWNMGIVIVNNFILGRYMHVGPQQTLYLPATLLSKGFNEIIVFEHFIPAPYISFSLNPIYKTKK